MNDQEALAALRGKERVYEVGLKIERLYPAQRLTRSQRVYLGKVYEGTKRAVNRRKTEESDRPDVVEESKRLVDRYENAKVFTWPMNGDKAVDLAPVLCGRWGLIHKAFFEYWHSLRKAPYIVEMLDALRVEAVDGTMSVTVRGPHGDNPAESPFSILVPRNGRGGTMQVEYADFIEDHDDLKFRVRIPAELPLSRDEFISLLHGLEMQEFGPYRRGRVAITSLTATQNGYAGTEARKAGETLIP